MSVTLAPPMFLQFMDPNNSGSPAAGFKLFTYAGGTSTKQATWTDSTQTVQNPNPLTLDANGCATTASGTQVWGDPTLAYKFVLAGPNDTDPPTSPLRTTDFLYFPLTAQAITSLQFFYPQTQAEINAGVTPANFAYAPGDFRRYGADPTGVAASDIAIQKCLSCNVDCFDGQPGGGTYLLTQGLVIGASPVTIRGGARYMGSGGTGTGAASGTQLVLTSTTVGAAHITNTAFIYGFRIADIGFTFTNNQYRQRAILFNNDARYGVIERNAFWGINNSTNTNSGIQFLHSTIFSGDVVIKDNLFDGLIQPIVFGSSVTTVKVLNNEAYGYGNNGNSSQGSVQAFTLAGGSGYTPSSTVVSNVLLNGGTGTLCLVQLTVTGGVVTNVVIIDGGTGYKPADVLTTTALSGGSGFSITATTVGSQRGIGIQCQRPTTEVRMTNNYFEGFTTGIYGDDGVWLAQIANDYQVCLQGFFWTVVNVTSTFNVSIGDTGVSGIFPALNANNNTVFGSSGGLLSKSLSMAAPAGFTEADRAVANGHWTDITYSGGNFGGQWAPSGGQVTLERYTLVGNMLTLSLVVTGATITATGTTLTFTFPFVASKTLNFPAWVTTGAGTKQFGLASTGAATSVITIYADATQVTNWPTGGSGGVNFTISFQINGAFA